MLRVLVADDDPTALAFLGTLLRGEGYMVQTAGDGAAALEKARDMVPDVLLTDVEMPGLSGNQLVAAVRNHDKLKGMYVVVFTSHGEKADQMRAFLSGADDFVVKPGGAAEILGRMEIARRVLGMRREAREALAAARRAAAPDGATVAALETVLGRVRDLVAEAEREMARPDPDAARVYCGEARAALEKALLALRKD